ncbi:hypothetical protein IWW34DRAFT_604657, partial [Fusarium oxysporum f. sp. albedinis]|uniref:uncharacterized protein n=1 Tax=Fusarium oxysporum Fo47 TaxID=660027 RepID=UPI002869A231
AGSWRVRPAGMARHHFAMESALQACARREATIAVTGIAVQLDTRFTANASTTLAAQLSGVGQRLSAIQNHVLLDGTRQGEVIGETVAIVSLGRRDSSLAYNALKKHSNPRPPSKPENTLPIN